MSRTARAACTVGTIILGLAACSSEPQAVGPVPTTGGAALQARLSIATDCLIGAAATTCAAASMKVVSGLIDFQLPCSVGEAFTNAKGQTGTCSIDGGTRRPAVVPSLVKGSCNSFSISPRAGTVSGRFLDSAGLAWSIDRFRLSADTHVYEAAQGADTWKIGRLGSDLLLRRSGDPPRRHLLRLSGTVRSTSRCANGIEARSFTVDLTGDPATGV